MQFQKWPKIHFWTRKTAKNVISWKIFFDLFDFTTFFCLDFFKFSGQLWQTYFKLYFLVYYVSEKSFPNQFLKSRYVYAGILIAKSAMNSSPPTRNYLLFSKLQIFAPFLQWWDHLWNFFLAKELLGVVSHLIDFSFTSATALQKPAADMTVL